MSRAAALIVALLVSGCVEQDAVRPRPEADTAAPAWPTGPAPARVVYVRSLRASTDVEPRGRTSALKALAGGGVEAVATLAKPYAVAARGGRVYVTDTVLRLVHVFDGPRRRYFQFGVRREGRLTKPLGIAVDARGMVYVADSTDRRVVVYDAIGLYQRALGGPHELIHPTGVGVSPDGSRVYVVDAGRLDGRGHHVVVYDGAGRRIDTIGERGTAPGQFNLPVAAAVDRHGTLYVLDAGNFRIQAFGPDHRALRSWGSVGRGLGQFARPKALAVDTRGRVYVADASFGNVQIFDASGELLLPVGTISRTDEPGRFALLTGVGVDEAGFVYMVDGAFRKVEVLRTVGD